MTDSRARSPLAHRESLAADDGSYRLSEKPFLSKLILRVDRQAVGSAVSSVLGAELPDVSQSATTDKATVLWLGPDEWMVIAAPDMESDLAGALGGALSDVHHQIARVSDYYTTIEISGIGARHALSKLSTLDLHPRAFKPGEVRGSTFAKATCRPSLQGDRSERHV